MEKEVKKKYGAWKKQTAKGEVIALQLKIRNIQCGLTLIRQKQSTLITKSMKIIINPKMI